MDCSVRHRDGRTRAWLMVLLSLLGPGLQGLGVIQVWAQAPSPAPDTQGAVSLQPVVVTAPRVATPITDVPAAISVVDKTAIQSGQPTIGLDESLVRVPGVFTQNRFNFAQDLRFSIRGFGARAAFGIRGIKILVDGIPETLPDGQSDLDSLDLGAVQRVEVLRGPTSALYGNASGGVINIVSEDGPARPFVEARTTHGEYGLWKMQLKSGGQVGPLNYLLSASRLELGGFRRHSRAESLNVNGKLRLEINKASQLTALLSVVEAPQADDPGALTRAEAEADPRQAAPNNLRFGAGEEVTQGRLGLVYRWEFLPLHDLEVTGYYTGRQFRNAIPFRTVEFERSVFGGGLKYGYRGAVFAHRSRLTAGVDVQHQRDRRKNFDNVNGRSGTMLLLSQDERATSVGPYVQEEFDVLDDLTLVLGGRYDNVHFSVDDFLTANGDDTGARTFDQLTGRFGLLYRVRPAVHLYVNVAQSFETPTFTEIVNRPAGGGGINSEIKPQKAINYEIGGKGEAWRRLTYEVALFYITLEDELIRFSDATGRDFFRNAGASQRYGVELGASLEILPGLRAHVAYTYLKTRFQEFIKNGMSLRGNDVPGLPPHQVYAEDLLSPSPGVLRWC